MNVKICMYIIKFKNAHITYFKATQYPIILYMPTQILIDIEYQKTGFKRKFSRFLTNMNYHPICFENTISI